MSKEAPGWNPSRWSPQRIKRMQSRVFMVAWSDLCYLLGPYDR